jgi:hypothetical protein
MHNLLLYWRKRYFHRNVYICIHFLEEEAEEEPLVKGIDDDNNNDNNYKTDTDDDNDDNVYICRIHNLLLYWRKRYFHRRKTIM